MNYTKKEPIEIQTVGELKALLQQFPDDMPIDWADEGEGIGRCGITVDLCEDSNFEIALRESDGTEEKWQPTEHSVRDCRHGNIVELSRRLGYPYWPDFNSKYWTKPSPTPNGKKFLVIC